MQKPVGMFTMTWRLICKFPSLVEYFFDLLGPLLDNGSMFGQIIFLIFLAKVVLPGVYWLIDYGWDLFIKFIKLFEK